MLILTHEACLGHDPGKLHPERPDRLRAVLAGVEEFAAQQPVEIREAPQVTREALLRVHTTAYIDRLEKLFPNEGRVQLDPDTIMSPGTREAVYRGAGAMEYAVDEVLAGRSKRVFCAVRPPGHHAEAELSMGFCLFNNVAIGAAKALDAGLERIAIVDFDVHHGNGTQEAFYDDGRVLFISMHQYPFYPGTGDLTETGCGAGEGATVNLPFPAGTSGDTYRAAIEEVVVMERAWCSTRNEGSAPASIDRLNRQRQITVTSNPAAGKSQAEGQQAPRMHTNSPASRARSSGVLSIFRVSLFMGRRPSARRP